MHLDFGVLTEGVVDYDPVTQGYVLLVTGEDGTVEKLCLTELLERYRGTEVRLVLVPTATITVVSGQVEQGVMDEAQIPRAGSGNPT